MPRIRTREDLTELARQGVLRMASERPRLSVGMSSCGLAAGAGELFDVLRSEGGDKVRLGIDAPSNVPIHRQEVYDAIRRQDDQRNTPPKEVRGA